MTSSMDKKTSIVRLSSTSSSTSPLSMSIEESLTQGTVVTSSSISMDTSSSRSVTQDTSVPPSTNYSTEFIVEPVKPAKSIQIQSTGLSTVAAETAGSDWVAESIVKAPTKKRAKSRVPKKVAVKTTLDASAISAPILSLSEPNFAAQPVKTPEKKSSMKTGKTLSRPDDDFTLFDRSPQSASSLSSEKIHHVHFVTDSSSLVERLYRADIIDAKEEVAQEVNLKLETRASLKEVFCESKPFVNHPLVTAPKSIPSILKTKQDKPPKEKAVEEIMENIRATTAEVSGRAPIASSTETSKTTTTTKSKTSSAISANASRLPTTLASKISSTSKVSSPTRPKSTKAVVSTVQSSPTTTSSKVAFSARSSPTIIASSSALTSPASALRKASSSAISTPPTVTSNEPTAGRFSTKTAPEIIATSKFSSPAMKTLCTTTVGSVRSKISTTNKAASTVSSPTIQTSSTAVTSTGQTSTTTSLDIASSAKVKSSTAPASSAAIASSVQSSTTKAPSHTFTGAAKSSTAITSSKVSSIKVSSPSTPTLSKAPGHIMPFSKTPPVSKAPASPDTTKGPLSKSSIKASAIKVFYSTSPESGITGIDTTSTSTTPSSKSISGLASSILIPATSISSVSAASSSTIPCSAFSAVLFFTSSTSSSSAVTSKIPSSTTSTSSSSTSTKTVPACTTPITSNSIQKSAKDKSALKTSFLKIDDDEYFYRLIDTMNRINVIGDGENSFLCNCCGYFNNTYLFESI